MARCVGAIPSAIPFGAQCYAARAVCVVSDGDGFASQLIPACSAVVIRIPAFFALQNVVSLICSLILAVSGAIVYSQIKVDSAGVVIDGLPCDCPVKA